ncbi:MAG: hypothetical protein CMP47_03035 [Rickettsiales bacterium]|nr:hypothetical protein [Rickettsiales bacterium]
MTAGVDILDVYMTSSIDGSNKREREAGGRKRSKEHGYIFVVTFMECSTAFDSKQFSHIIQNRKQIAA